MTIQYINPLSAGIARMKRALFQPFDLKKWFVVGFTAFLAGLAEFRISGGNPGRAGSGFKGKGIEKILYFPQHAWEWLTANPGWAIAIASMLAVGTLIVAVLTWLSARGKFMFLDNVVNDRSNVLAPWHQYAREGNSFFLFHLSWGVLVLAVTLVYLFYGIAYLRAMYESTGSTSVLVFPAFFSGLGLLAILTVMLFVYLLFRDFVVPIMYRDRSTVLKAAQKFSPLFFSQPIHFIGYALFLFCLILLTAAAILLFGCITCCIGFLILAIPYINAVVLLPVSYSLRSFSVEFLEQFGPEYHVFPRPEINPPPPPVTP